MLNSVHRRVSFREDRLIVGSDFGKCIRLLKRAEILLVTEAKL